MKILIMGATSAIAQEAAKLWAGQGHHFFLAGMETDKLKLIAQDLKLRGAKQAEIFMLDALDYDRHSELVPSALRALGGLDAALVAHGYLGNQTKAQTDLAELRRITEINYTSAVSLISLIAAYFEKQGWGCLAAISSAAGDRGRQSNYVYGAAKGALTVFLSGLRNRLSGTKVKIVTIKPGMVDTPMTAGMKKGLLFSSPQTVGRGIVRAMRNGTPVAYVPGIWQIIMFVIKHIPESIFKKMHL